MPRYFGTEEINSWRCPYKQHLVCFKCHRGWKVNGGGYPLAKCGKCGELGKEVGIDCRIPKKNDIINWKRLCYLVEVDHTFFQYQDCESLTCGVHIKNNRYHEMISNMCHSEYKHNTLTKETLSQWLSKKLFQ